LREFWGHLIKFLSDIDSVQELSKGVRGFQDLPVGYTDPNPWKGHKDATELVRQMLTEFTAWCMFLPEISGNQDNGLKYIQRFAWFYFRNRAGQDFVQGRDPNNKENPLITGLKFTRDFSNQRGAFMNSKASVANVERIRIDCGSLRSHNLSLFVGEFYAQGG
jgi:phosphatidylserine decarboxylase